MRLNYGLCLVAGSLLLVGTASADELQTLRTTLGAMHASGPFAATLDVRNTTRGGDEDKPETTHAHLKLSVGVGAEGLQLGFSRGLLERVAGEKATHARDPNQSAPTVALLDDISPGRVQTMVDFAPALLRRLEGAKLTSQRDQAHDGKPAHLLVFSIPAGLGKSDSDAIKDYKGELKVWLGRDGVPLAIDESRLYKGRKFFISFQTSSAISADLQRVGQRLIAVNMQRESKGSGFGQMSDSVTKYTLTPQVPPAAASVAPAPAGTVTPAAAGSAVK